jgi:hypothetical protein
MFVDKKTGKCKPNLYSHVDSHGFSVQREKLTTDVAACDLAKIRLEAQQNQAWYGVVMAACHPIRQAVSMDRMRMFCVYDTGLELNHAHAEIFRSRGNIPEADAAEQRNALYRIFGDGVILKNADYRGGSVWNLLPAPLRSRPHQVKIQP